MATGIVKNYNSERGYGLLFPLGEKRDAPLIFFHVTSIRGGIPPVGSEVKFAKVRADNEEGVQAANVELLERGGQRTLRQAEQEQRRMQRIQELRNAS